ncbi:MAG: DNA-processing protein DprA, partial [Clostridiales bacterium]|nr:DNA-processing protein DprA [Clostridiales bacterium]
MENDFYWYWFVNIPGVGRVTQKRLLERFGHPKEVFLAPRNRYRDLLTSKQLASLEQSRKQINHDIFGELKKNNSRFLHWESTDYPEKFRQIFDPPYGLYVRGRLPMDSRPTLELIGARAAPSYGIQMAEYFAEIFATQGIQIVGGLASGIDAACHRGALRGNGYTLGILGGGIDTIYPRENFNLYWEMYERGGVLSEYNLGIPNHPGLFPERNRLISAISDGVFVIEAGKKSGSLITADQALEQGKDVFALPGRITDRLSVGCNHLIAEGAIPVLRPEDVLQALDSRQHHAILDNRPPLQEGRNGEQESREFRESKPETGETSLTGTDIGGKGKSEQQEEETFLVGPPFHNLEQKWIYHLLDEKTPKSFNEILKESG